jgi:hypothetical protein
MFRFTIRDVLWLMLTVGLAVCWYRDHDPRPRLTDEWLEEKDKLQHQLLTLQHSLGTGPYVPSQGSARTGDGKK